jgi:hypothetical protein
MFGSKVFLKYFKNTIVSEKILAYNTLRRLAMDKNYGINTKVTVKL